MLFAACAALPASVCAVCVNALAIYHRCMYTSGSLLVLWMAESVDKSAIMDVYSNAVYPAAPAAKAAKPGCSQLLRQFISGTKSSSGDQPRDASALTSKCQQFLSLHLAAH